MSQPTTEKTALCTPLQVSGSSLLDCCMDNAVPYYCNVCKSWLTNAWAICRHRTMGCQRFDTITGNYYVANWWTFQVPRSQLTNLQEQDHGAVVCPDCLTLSPSASTLQIHLDENMCAQSFQTSNLGWFKGSFYLQRRDLHTLRTNASVLR